jgi:methylglyoxal synthase
MSYTFTAPPKDPQATLRHGINWGDWLQDGETITAQSMTAPTGITADQVTQATGVVSYRISGGTAGTDYVVTCQITTSQGRIDERSVLYRVRNR